MSDNIKFNRVFSMPSKDTFDMKPIGEFVKRYLTNSTISIDPYARNKNWATHTNDLNPETSASNHMDSAAFLELLLSQNIIADLIILDPPYSQHQACISYKGYGKKVITLTPVYDLAAKLLKIGGVVLTFGFNSTGLGMKRGFEKEEILLVNNGGHHNDYICLAERKIK